MKTITAKKVLTENRNFTPYLILACVLASLNTYLEINCDLFVKLGIDGFRKKIDYIIETINK